MTVRQEQTVFSMLMIFAGILGIIAYFIPIPYISGSPNDFFQTLLPGVGLIILGYLINYKAINKKLNEYQVYK